MNIQNLLYEACKHGHLEIIKYLHKNGADITADNNYATRCTAINGHSEVVKYLHEHGANITAGNNCATRWAAEKGRLEVVKYCLSVPKVRNSLTKKELLEYTKLIKGE